MRLTIIAADANGDSHYHDSEIELSAQSFVPPAPPLEISAPVQAARGIFFRIPPGWFGDWHPAPCRQYYVQTSGELEVQVSDGEIRRFLPGDVVLVEDVTGKGHTTRVVSHNAVCGVYVQLAEPST